MTNILLRKQLNFADDMMFAVPPHAKIVIFARAIKAEICMVTHFIDFGRSKLDWLNKFLKS